MIRVNPYTQKAFTVRSTGTNEADNRLLERLFDSPYVGIARAERIILGYYEASNERKAVRRLGAKPSLTNRTESVYHMASMATAAVFTKEDLPATMEVAPKAPVKEYLGLNFALPAEFEAAGASTDDEEDRGDSNHDFAQFLAGVDFDLDDVPVNPTQFGTVVESSVDSFVLT